MNSRIRKLSLFAALVGLTVFPMLSTAGEEDRRGRADEGVVGERDEDNPFEDNPARIDPGEILVPEDRGLRPDRPVR